MAGDSGFEDLPGGLLDYVNVPPTIGMLISWRPELIGPLSTTLGLEDMHDLLEVRRIDLHNARVIRKWREKRDRESG